MMKPLIQKLVETPGPSGFEQKIREVIRSEIAPYADEVRVDNLGNLIARKGQKTANGQRIMLSGHMDEIGVMATHIDENGFVRFITMGGVRPHTCLGGRVIFMDGTRGVIGGEKLESMEKVNTIEQLFIDVGATNRDNCPVKVGYVAGFERPFLDLGNRLVAKSMDDRISCAVMVEALRTMKQTPNEIYFVFSVQEEVGIRGATTAAFGVDPDLGLAVDVTGVGDTPKGSRMEISLGKGAAIKIRDSSFIADPRIVNWMVSCAEKNHVLHQLEVLEAGGTDGHAIQLARAGVPAGCLSIPCRYIHSPSEMVDFNDVQNAVHLLVELISNPVVLE
jgi:putative aminopeptidase FrvX